MTSKIQLISNALILLGDEPISSLSDPGAGAKAGANLYDSTYKSFLASNRWNFATKKVKLSRLSEVPQNEFQYQFQLPTDIITMITTYPVSTYKILEDKLYSDYQEIEIDYIYKITEDKLPAYCIKSLELKIAVELAIPVTEDYNKLQILERMYKDEIKMARYADSAQVPPTPIQDTPYISVRVI